MKLSSQYEGTIDQFLGDGVMALFGAPIAHDDHAQRACQAALAVRKALETYGESLKNRYGIDFNMRIGLNSGPVVVGSIGDDLRMDYTAKGDTVNTASRLEDASEAGRILVSRDTYRLAREAFTFLAMEPILARGRSLAALSPPGWDEAEAQMAESLRLIELDGGRLFAARTKMY